MAGSGYVVFYVQELERSLHFYTGVVGLDLQGMIFNGRAVLLGVGSIHDG